MQTEFINLELPRTKPTLALESCADFFDRDYATLAEVVENQLIKYSWNIAVDLEARRQIRVFAQSAWAYCYNRPMPHLSEDEVYRMILPGRDIRSTELERILACSHQHIYDLRDKFVVTRQPERTDGPTSFTVFSRNSIVEFLKSRRLS